MEFHVEDIFIWAALVEEHDIILEEVLRKLREAGLTLNRKKCQFRVAECTFLGHRISGDGIMPSKQKVEAIAKLDKPRDVVSLRSFIGSASYHLKFPGHDVTPNAFVLKPLVRKPKLLSLLSKCSTPKTSTSNM